MPSDVDAGQPVTGPARSYTMESDQPAEAMLASMKLNGIDHLWFTSGSEIGVFQEGAVKHQALGKPTPRIMTMTHENAALAAACGETIVTGKPSATAFHVEVGLLNAGGALHNADRGHHPVLIMSGYPASAEAGSAPGARTARIQWYQQVPDQGSIVRQYMRWDHKLATHDNAGLVITRATQVMLSAPQGPAYLALPREVSMHPTQRATFPLVDQLQPVGAGRADRSDLRQAAAWLLAAESPVISVGRVGRDPEAFRALVELAETVGARVLADTHNGLTFPQSHPLNLGVPTIAPVPADTDCVLMLDILVPWMPGQFDPGPDVRLIRIASDPVHRVTPIYEFPTDLAMRADIGDAIQDLLEEVRSLATPEHRRAAAARVERAREAASARVAKLHETADRDRAQGVIHPLLLSRALGEIDPEAIFVHELVEGSLFNRNRPGTLVGPGGSSIGFGAPMAVGIKVAASDRPVVAAVGDGSWMFSNPQVCTWASAFHAAPVLFVVFNNRGYRTGTHEVVRAYPDGYSVRSGDFTGGVFDPAPQYAAEAAASGHFGEKVTDPEELPAAIERGLKATEEGSPGVLEVWLPKHITGEV